jgi:ribose transport system permease protein
MGVLAVGIAGLEQLGSSFFVEPLFDGLVLISAVGVAGYTARRRGRTRRQVIKTRQSDSPVSPPDTVENQANAADENPK